MRHVGKRCPFGMSLRSYHVHRWQKGLARLLTPVRHVLAQAVKKRSGISPKCQQQIFWGVPNFQSTLQLSRVVAIKFRKDEGSDPGAMFDPGDVRIVDT